jgi:hypothetical protein
MAENPYFHRGPIRDSKFFFGRTAEAQEVLRCVSRRQSVSVVGPRRIGKTSLLFHLAEPEVKAAHGLGDDYVFVYVDCQALSGALAESDVYRELLKDVVEVIQDVRSAEHGSQELVTYLDFKRSLDEIVAPGIRIVLMFDEFEEIACNGHLGRSFFNELRGLGQTDKVVYVTASSETLSDLAFHDKTVLSSPFFNIFYPVWLGFMKSEEARALVDGVAAMAAFEGFDESDHAFLHAIAGLHPFYLQVGCYYLFEEKAKGTGLIVPDYGLVRHQFAREIRGHFQYAWTRLSHNEQKGLRLIAEGSTGELTPKDLERLEQRCLVCQGQIFSSVFAEFVSDAVESESVGIDHTSCPTPQDAQTQGTSHNAPLAWKFSGVLFLLVLLLGALLAWQAPAFVERSVSSMWDALKALWSALGQIGDASGGLLVIVVALSIVIAGIKERRRIRQILYDLWDRLT